MLRASWADSYGPESCQLDRGYRRTWPAHVDRSRNNVYVAACRSSSRSPPWGGEFGSSHHTAAQGSRGGLDEYQRTAPYCRPVAVRKKPKGLVWAARGELRALGSINNG